MAENETKLCNNCKKQISVNNFMMHEMHCKRHIGLCEHCQEPIPTGEMAVHFEENHAKIKCPKCKVEVEKMKLEEHEENDCSKRPMKCVYCELEFPKDDFNAHIDYCGSRTEPCTKCLQYIKLKDQTKHEESNCAYPEASKPKNTNRTDLGGMSDLNGGGYGMNPFAFEELSRVIGQRGGGGSSYPTRPSQFQENQMDNTRQRASRPSKVPNVSRPAAGRSNESNLNRNRKKSKDPSIGDTASSEVDYDQLLAMHLAQDLNHEEDYDAVVRAIEKPSPPTPPHQFERYAGMDRNTFTEDLVLIPCEFCGEPFTSDDLVQHQSSCSLDRISAMLPKLTSSRTNNSRSDHPVSPTLVDPPDIINNLRPFDATEWLDDTANPINDAADDDDMLLPCEFCDDLFPMETLIQHQAICDSNATMTPRVTTPVATRSRVKNLGLNLNHNLADDFPNLSSRRHQPAPGYKHNSDSEDDTVVNNTHSKYTIGATAHRVRKPSTTTVSKRKDTSSSATSPTAKVNTMLRKYGVEGHERGDYYSRPGSQNSRVSETDSWLQPSASVPKKRTDTDARTRDTLNSLLNDREGRSSHDLLGHIGAAGAPKTKRIDESNPTRQKVSVVPATRNAARVRATNTNARDVHRELTRSGATASNTQTPARNRPPKSIEVRVRPSAADELSDTVLGNQRSRAQVFGTRNTNPPTTRRKPEGY